MRKTYWKSGEWNAICDQCGMKRKSSELTERWDGLMVCRPAIKPGCWEVRHPQELIRPIPDQPALPWSRPDPVDSFVSADGLNTVDVAAASSSVVITDSNISASSTLLIEGWIPVTFIEVVRMTLGAGTATLYFSPVPSVDITLTYRVVG